MDRLISKEEIERLENIVYRYNRESRGWHDCNDIRLNSNDIKAIEKAINLIKAIPSAEPKTGHWIEHPEIETSAPEYLMFYECSECGDKQCFCKSDIHKKHFCNNCGAKMD